MKTGGSSYIYNKAIVRKPGRSLVNGITTAELGKPDLELAVRQHKNYISTLQFCGVEVIILDTDEQYPDSVFVEDTAVLTPEFAVVSRPQPLSRAGEIESMSMVLDTLYDKVEAIRSPGTLEGGDILQIDDSFYIGLSERTNQAGADQFIEIVKKYGYKGFNVRLRDLLHLKTGISYLGENTILVTPELAKDALFDRFEKILVIPDEAYAANCIRVNDTLIFPSGFPNTLEKLKKAGFKTQETEMSEFCKLDGGLSCLSLRFHR
jgi:dimethylargininase